MDGNVAKIDLAALGVDLCPFQRTIMGSPSRNVYHPPPVRRPAQPPPASQDCSGKSGMRPRPLYHTVPDGGNTEDADLTPIFRNLHLPVLRGPVGSGDQFVTDAIQERLEASLFDGRETHTVNARGTAVASRRLVGLPERLRLAYMDVQPPETPVLVAFALRYILLLRSCKLMDVFVIPSLPPLLSENCSTAGRLCSAGVTPPQRCRVGGGAPRGRWPPSAAQTVRAVFPHTAFTKTSSRDEDRWRNQRVDPPPARRVQPVGKSPRSLMLGSFTHGTVHLSALAHLTVLSGPDRLRRPPSPTHSVAAT